ncbi:fatty acid desaturase [uncultured Aquimarina sp.]|uniref:fatty acid desaturase n=1 Tax=uncultured Aquimarina sp. TaxID=575652 RepID=UPI0026116072|nr:fatty acid desaturase [uncultured Aquimarina sp.]
MKNQAVWQKYSGKVAWPTIILFVFLCLAYMLLWKLYSNGFSPIWTSTIGAVIAYGMFTIAHEASHGNIAGGVSSFEKIEQILGWVSSFFLLFPFSAFVVIHLRHHAHTNDPEHDPDHYVNGSNPFSIFFRCLTLIGHYFGLTFGKNSIKNTAMRNIKNQSLVFLIFIVSLISTLIAMGYGSALFFVFILSALIAAPILAFSFDWLPHYPHNNLGKYHNTRIVTIPGLELVSLYQSYHLIHHLYPRVPFYKYKSCFKDVELQLFEKKSIVEGFRNKDLALLDKKNTYEDIISGSVWNYVLEVENVFHETKDAVKIVFKNLDQIPFSFLPGQYVVISDYVSDQLVSRCYSICEDPITGKLSVVVKKVPKGKLSNHLVNHTKSRKKLRVSGPFGRFLLPEVLDRSFLFIAGGSGITPIISMIKYVLRTSKNEVKLLYGNKSNEDIIFANELQELSSLYPNRFNYIKSLQLLDKETQQGYLLETSTDTYCYVCGPAPMMDASKQVLTALGLNKKLIHYEEFSQNIEKLSGKTQSISVEGRDQSFIYEGDQSESILESALRNEQQLPYACKKGDCGTCKVQLLKGQVQWKPYQDMVLLDNEIDQGYILTCMCTPETDLKLKL